MVAQFSSVGRIFGAAICILFLTVSVSGGAERDGSIGQLGKSAFVKGEFIQQRHLKGFSRPLVSGGEFSYWQLQGVYWETQKPFFRAVTYSNSETIHWGADGKSAEVVKSDMVQKLVSRIIQAMLSADINLLSEQFLVEMQPRSDGWSMMLTPKLKAVAQIIQQIDVVGADYLQKIDLLAINGDKTVIQFVNILESSRPSGQECQHFFAEVNQSCQ